jgi:hypothetical protein
LKFSSKNYRVFFLPCFVINLGTFGSEQELSTAKNYHKKDLPPVLQNLVVLLAEFGSITKKKAQCEQGRAELLLKE